MQTLVGKLGVAATDLWPDGQVRVDGEIWQARSFDGDEKYLPGERVRVVKVQGATAIVWRDDLPNI